MPPITHERPGLEIEDCAPEYWRKNGVAHWEVRASCGTSASAVRSERGDLWTVFGPDGERDHESASLSDGEIIDRLGELVRIAVERSLTEMKEIRS